MEHLKLGLRESSVTRQVGLSVAHASREGRLSGREREFQFCMMTGKVGAEMCVGCSSVGGTSSWHFLHPQQSLEK